MGFFNVNSVQSVLSQALYLGVFFIQIGGKFCPIILSYRFIILAAIVQFRVCLLVA